MPPNYYVYGLYAPTRPTGSLFYIGKGKNSRLYKHYQQCSLRKSTHKNNVIAFYNTYPCPIHGGLTEQFAFELEKCLIKLYKQQLTNKTDGGEGTSGRTHSKQTRAKISASNKGKKLSKAHIAILSKVNKHKTVSKDTREKLSKANQGKKHSEETKAKISKIHKGKIISESQKDWLSKANSGEGNPNFGKRLSEATKTRISEANKGREPINKISREFIKYHVWAQSISGLTQRAYCVNKSFTYNAFVIWKAKIKAGKI
jgi:hypothetical protein